MTYRNDLDAANARIESLERERRELLEQQARLNRPARRPWWRTDLSEHAPDDFRLAMVSVGGVVGFIIMMVAAALQR